MNENAGVNGGKKSALEVEGRARVRVVVVGEEEYRVARFLHHPVLSGTDDSRWFPIAYDEDLFEALERILTDARVAANVTRMEPVSAYQDGRSWDVVFNAREEGA